MPKAKLLNYLIAAVWLINGLFCKVLNLVPRHQQIVARILGNTHALLLTRLIGCAEILMALWIISGYKPRLNALTQVIVIAAMNTLEFIMVPDLLLWGRFNALFALLFILIIIWPYLKNHLKNHPFAVSAFFESSLVFTFAIPKEQIQHLIPECLTLDTFEDKWAFIAVAMVQTKSLRPKGFPQKLGNDFFLIGYRVFVRFTNKAGKNLRGLYILKSETDKKKMQFMGNIFTHYNYTTTDIQQNTHNGTTSISSKKSGFNVSIDTTEDASTPLPSGTSSPLLPSGSPSPPLPSGSPSPPLPPGSPFADWKEARRYAGPLPFTFTYNPKTKEVLIIEGVRENWKPAPVKVLDQKFSFIENMNLSGARLANAFIIRNIPYYWKKGKIEQWK